MIFKNWALRCLIYLVILNIAIAILLSSIIAPLGEPIETPQLQTIFYFSIAATIAMYAGIVFLVLSFIKKETRDYKFYIAAIGLPVFVGFSVVAWIIRNYYA